MRTFTTKLIVAVFLFAVLVACGKEEKKPVPEPVVKTQQPEPAPVAEPEFIADEPEPAPQAEEPQKPAPKTKTAEAAKPEPAKPESAPAPEPKPEPKAAEKSSNPFLGKWIARDGGDRKCILEFKENGVLIVEQYQTYGDGLVTCSGRGTYSPGDNKLGFNFKLENSDKSSKLKCGTSSRGGNQTYKLSGDRLELTGNESDGAALLRSWFSGKGGKISNTDYYKTFTRVK